jgi:hypothetical protein
MLGGAHVGQVGGREHDERAGGKGILSKDGFAEGCRKLRQKSFPRLWAFTWHLAFSSQNTCRLPILGNTLPPSIPTLGLSFGRNGMQVLAQDLLAKSSRTPGRCPDALLSAVHSSFLWAFGVLVFSWQYFLPLRRHLSMGISNL